MPAHARICCDVLGCHQANKREDMASGGAKRKNKMDIVSLIKINEICFRRNQTL